MTEIELELLDRVKSHNREAVRRIMIDHPNSISLECVLHGLRTLDQLSECPHTGIVKLLKEYNAIDKPLEL